MLKISRPTLVVNESICRANIRKMLTKANNADVAFRPHFKTHISGEIGRWFKEEGVSMITVSSVAMAEYFSEDGWTDITIAFPYNPLEAQAINHLAKKINLSLLIESKEALDHINHNISSPLHYWIKIDVGTGRTGVSEAYFDRLNSLSVSQNPDHHYVGVLAHAGHTYKVNTPHDIESVFINSKTTLRKAASHIEKHSQISYGDTPSCSLLQNWSGVDEMRPGNFIFYDAMQYHFGSCSLDDIAVRMFCPVVAVHPERNEAVIHGGAVHLSKDRLPTDAPFGLVVSVENNHWSTKVIGSVIRLSQEHGIISGHTSLIAALKIGDMVGIIPVHSCLTADLQGSYLSLDGRPISKMLKG